MIKKVFEKITSIVLSLTLMFNPVLIGTVWGQEAQEEISTQTTDSSGSVQGINYQEGENPDNQGQNNDTITLTPAPIPIETQGEGTSNIQTGSATSQAEVDTVVNINENTIPGEITSGEGDCTPPEGETSCPEDVNFKNDNLADIEDTSVSSAQTGSNSIIGTSGDAETESGDATASGTIEVVANVNSLVFEPETEEQESLESEDREVVVENKNQAEVDNQAQVSSDTGENISSDNLGDSTIITGDAQALANIINLLNLNVVGSNFQIDISNFEDGLTGDVNFNEIWRKLLQDNGFSGVSVDKDGNITFISIENENDADLENNVLVSSDTGENMSSGNGGNSNITTGDATSLANVFNLVNLNLFGSRFYLGVINIFGSFLGNLVIPNPDVIVDYQEEVGSLEESRGDENKGVVFENRNEVEVEDSVNSLATTGENNSIGNLGNDSIITGNALSQANSFSFLNTNVFRNNWFFLVINALGRRMGKILAWSSPDSVSDAKSEEVLIYDQGLMNSQSEVYPQEELNNQLINDITNEIIFRNKNQAKIKNSILTTANTGRNNSLQNAKNSSINTGNAISLANLFNLVNLNILGSRWFMGVVNVLGDWQGDTIVAYPDMAVEIASGVDKIEVGGTIEYKLTYQNKGYDTAKNVVVRLSLPQGVTYLSDTSRITPIISGNNLDWVLGDLTAGASGGFSVLANVDPSVLDQEKTSFFSKFVKEVYADGGTREAVIVTSVFINTIDPEYNLSDNISTTSTTVFEGEQLPDTRLPILEISAKNNVNDFVYPGDVITFQVKIKNSGDVEAKDVVLVQSLHNGVPGDFGKAIIKVGTIKPKQEGTLTFGVALSNGHILPEGNYHTEAQAIGYAPSGKEVSSNVARTDFRIEYRLSSIIPQAKAEEEVLATSEIACETPKVKDEILPYVLLLLMSSMYLTSWGRIKLAHFKNEAEN